MNTYDIVTIQVNAAEEKEVSILPSSAGVNFFCITSDQYGKKNDSTKFLENTIKTNAATPEDLKIVLDRPHVLIGESVLNKIGNFSKIGLKNATDSDANVRVFFGRNI